MQSSEMCQQSIPRRVTKALQLQERDAHLQRLTMARDLLPQPVDFFFLAHVLDCVDDLAKVHLLVD